MGELISWPHLWVRGNFRELEGARNGRVGGGGGAVRGTEGCRGVEGGD